jgi:hypothetical protein
MAYVGNGVLDHVVKDQEDMEKLERANLWRVVAGALQRDSSAAPDRGDTNLGARLTVASLQTLPTDTLTQVMRFLNFVEVGTMQTQLHNGIRLFSVGNPKMSLIEYWDDRGTIPDDEIDAIIDRAGEINTEAIEVRDIRREDKRIADTESAQRKRAKRVYDKSRPRRPRNLGVGVSTFGKRLLTRAGNTASELGDRVIRGK